MCSLDDFSKKNEYNFKQCPCTLCGSLYCVWTPFHQILTFYIFITKCFFNCLRTDYNQSCCRTLFQFKLTLSWLPSCSPCREVILQQLTKQKNQVKTKDQVLVIKKKAKNIYILHLKCFQTHLKCLKIHYSTFVASSNVNVQFPFTFSYMILYIALF